MYHDILLVAAALVIGVVAGLSFYALFFYTPSVNEASAVLAQFEANYANDKRVVETSVETTAAKVQATAAAVVDAAKAHIESTAAHVEATAAQVVSVEGAKAANAVAVTANADAVKISSAVDAVIVPTLPTTL